MIQISAVVMTLDEEGNIGGCLDSIREVADELFVVDSFSTDRTVEVARAHGARVEQHPFEGHRQQRAYSIEQARYDYVLVIDADERLSDELRRSMLAAKQNWTADCYWCNRLSYFGDRWIHHGAWYPDRKMRLFDRRKYQIGGINPHDRLEPAEGATEVRLRGDLLHYTNENIEDRARTVNKFSSIAARAFYERGKRGSLARVIFKPFFRFFIEYFLRRGFLDGFYGYVIARTSAYYVFLREAKLRAIRQSGKKRQFLNRKIQG
jgi:glycosyltransferase involved in cell wall biosynthesis